MQPDRNYCGQLFYLPRDVICSANATRRGSPCPAYALCEKLVLYQNGWVDRGGFRHVGSGGASYRAKGLNPAVFAPALQNFCAK